MSEKDLPKVVEASQTAGSQGSADVNQALHDGGYGTAAATGAALGAKAGEVNVKQATESVRDGASGGDSIGEAVGKMWSGSGDGEIAKLFRKEPSKDDRDQAEKKFDETESHLASDADKKLLEQMGHAILEGDSKALTAALAQLKDNPEKLKAFVAEMNRMFNETGAGVNLAVTKDGHVLVYGQHGSVAVEIDPAKGVVGERPISVGPDGTVTLQPGEILNGDPNKALKGIGDDAVRNTNCPIIDFHTEPLNPYHPYAPGDQPIWKEPHRLFPENDPLFQKMNRVSPDVLIQPQ